ncbi:MAG: Rid family detoxifying hydrolase [Candidatus Bathyarchaeia archaeon]
MKKEQVSTGLKLLGPYSEGMRLGNLVFAAGQIPLDRNTGEVVAGDIKTQTKQVLENMNAVLQAAGTSMENVVKTTVFLSDLTDFPGMNEVYKQYFPAPYPARSTVQVAGLLGGIRVEIEAIAFTQG